MENGELKVAIVGSRTFNDYSHLEFVMNGLRIMFSSISGFISGGAKGADSLAELYARNHSIPMFVIKPDWDQYGRSAGMIRNGEIIKGADIVVAFWDGKSKGTKNSIDRALAAKKRCFVFFDLHTKQQLRTDISKSDAAKHKAIPLNHQRLGCGKGGDKDADLS